MTDQQQAVLMNPQESLPTLQKWFGDVIVELWGREPTSDRRWLLAGCPVWGSYVRTLTDWCLPTMLAPENLKALRGSWLVFFTDVAGYPEVLKATHQFAQHNIVPIVKLMPDEVLNVINRHHSNRYWVLGACHNILMRMADRMDAGYHMMAPDHLYGQRYFANLKRLAPQHEIIAQTGISAEIQGAIRELIKYRNAQGWIAVPDRDLGTIAWRNLHAQTRAYIMNDAQLFDRMPHSHFMAWQGRDAVYTYCCHQNAAWLGPNVCHRAPNFMPATIDTRLPHFGNQMYFPTVDDGMTFIEVSDASKAAQTAPVGRDFFVSRCWAQTGFNSDYFPTFMQPSVTPIHPQDSYLPDDVIKDQHSAVAALLWQERPPAWMKLLQQALAPAA